MFAKKEGATVIFSGKSAGRFYFVAYVWDKTSEKRFIAYKRDLRYE